MGFDDQSVSLLAVGVEPSRELGESSSEVGGNRHVDNVTAPGKLVNMLTIIFALFASFFAGLVGFGDGIPGDPGVPDGAPSGCYWNYGIPGDPGTPDGIDVLVCPEG